MDGEGAVGFDVQACRRVTVDRPLWLVGDGVRTVVSERAAGEGRHGRVGVGLEGMLGGAKVDAAADLAVGFVGDAGFDASVEHDRLGATVGGDGDLHCRRIEQRAAADAGGVGAGWCPKSIGEPAALVVHGRRRRC